MRCAVLSFAVLAVLILKDNILVQATTTAVLLLLHVVVDWLVAGV